MVTGVEVGSDQSPRTVVLELNAAPERHVQVVEARLDDSGEMQESAERAATPATPAPEGKGPLYKCAICGEFVYESQLDYHVTICPDPNESSPALPTPEVKAKHSPSHSSPRRDDASEPLPEAPDKYEDMVQRESLAVSEETQKMWKQWKDSRLAEHHDAMVQRSSQKRTQLLHELRQKETQECTFQPKTLPRGSPRTFSRPDMTGEGKWVQRWDQRMKNQRLKQVEADHYAELTLKPKISPFAQAWSQKQAEAGGDGSVFERLYHAALQQEEKKNAVKRDRESEAEAQSPPRTQSPPRRIPTSELLYSDALDRRERLHIMKEQLQRRRFEESKERCAVNNKSRRYYWQLLERQIKAAFEAATNGQPLLAQASLEDFLVGFKCMRPRKNGEICDELESRLQAALWRHLDPNKDGHTDLLTMTVFFHVLMGAVDDAAQGASRSAALEETAASPSKSTASEGGSLALQSINEENTAEISNPVQAAVAISQGAPQEEGRRIVELLLRFDPIRLRSEFQPLYTHRMHYQAQQEKLPEKKDDAVVVNPAIDSKSRAMADELLKKQKGESGSLTHAELLLWRHRKTQEKKEELRSKIRIEEVSGCTFRPKCNPPKPKEGHVEILTPAGSSRAEVLYERGLADKKQREQKVRESEKARTTEEVRGCTFQPNLSKSVKSYTKASEAPTKVPKGFYETRQRIRAAYEVREKVLQQREDRMARIEATVPYQSPSRGQSPPAGPTRPKSGPKSAREGRRFSSPPPRSHPPEEAKDSVARGEGMSLRSEAVSSAPYEGSPAPGESKVNPKSPQETEEDKQPVLYVDVNVTPGQAPERIVLFQGQNISEVAAEFSAKHVLSPAMAQKLHGLLREVVLKQELQNHMK